LLRISECKRASPRASEYDPTIDAETFPKFLDIGNEIPSGVLFKTSVRLALSRTSLIEENDSICGGIEESAMKRIESAAGSAVKKHNRLTVGISTLLIVNLVNRRDLEHSLIVWFYLVIKRSHRSPHNRLKVQSQRL